MMSVCTTLWQITIGRVKTVVATGSIRNSQSHGFPTTLYDPANENQREDYYYSLILLFIPFRDDSLLLENETAEEAFHR